jgi:hypothetical protein
LWRRLRPKLGCGAKERRIRRRSRRKRKNFIIYAPCPLLLDCDDLMKKDLIAIRVARTGL